MNNELVILYVHHNKSPVTLHHYNLLKKYNTDKVIIPTGFEGGDLLDGSHVVKFNENYPKNDLLNTMLSGTMPISAQSDLIIYDFYLHHQDFNSYFVVEWDTYCNCSVDECYGEAFEKYDTFSGRIFTNKLDVSDADEKRYVKEWSWYRMYYTATRTREQEEKIGPYLGATYPTSLLYYKRKTLYDIVSLLLSNPRLYDNLQNEMRLGTLLQQSGYELNEYKRHTNQFCEQPHYRDEIKRGIKGYYHAIKDIL